MKKILFTVSLALLIIVHSFSKDVQIECLHSLCPMVYVNPQYVNTSGIYINECGSVLIFSEGIVSPVYGERWTDPDCDATYEYMNPNMPMTDVPAWVLIAKIGN
jgi:hypothetical protein